MFNQPAGSLVVWHDLMTNDVATAMEFYRKLIGWDYHIEHARDFAWNTGEADYPLISAGNQAHGGFVDPGHPVRPHWVPYVSVNDVERAVEKADALGAKVERSPFDVPGVGRNALIRDPFGTEICLFRASHGFPLPSGVFLHGELPTPDIEATIRFYRSLFDWKSAGGDSGSELLESADGVAIATVFRVGRSIDQISWRPFMAVADLGDAIRNATALGANMLADRSGVVETGPAVVLSDPAGAQFGLFQT